MKFGFSAPLAAGSASEDGIEITPKMIEAGVEELYQHPIMEPSLETMRGAVRAVFSKMLEARRLGDHAT